MTKKQMQRARELLARKLPWKKVTSAHYKSVAHEYIVHYKCRTVWNELAKIVRDHGEYREWRGDKFKYLTVGRFVYWTLWPVINRTYESALNNGGYPSKADQKRIFNRFWGGKKK